MKKFVNLTPHGIKLNDGREFLPSGKVARVATSFEQKSDDFCSVVWGEIENLPEPKAGTFFVVSALVKAATMRQDVVAPATGHPDTVRNDKGHIVSVPCFIQ